MHVTYTRQYQSYVKGQVHNYFKLINKKENYNFLGPWDYINYAT